MSAGKILRISQSKLGGMTIYLLDDNTRFLYYYAHLDHYSERIAPNMHVARGTILGYVGSTGNANWRCRISIFRPCGGIRTGATIGIVRQSTSGRFFSSLDRSATNEG